jgi:TonB family protein
VYASLVESALPLPARRHAPYWIGAILLALLLHALFIFTRIPESWVFWGLPAHAPPVKIHQVDPAKLAQIRRQWKEERAKQLLLSKEPKPSAAEPDNPDARYLSDRNRRVEREQRARQTAVLPKTARPPQARKRERPAQLSALGVPMPLRNHPPEETPDPGESGDQYVRDPRLPEGDQNLLNTQESVYYSFYSRMYEAIAPVWQSMIRQVAQGRASLAGGEYQTQLDVVFDREGNLLETRVLASSGIPAFDQVAQTAWRRIGRFPNPPRGLLDENDQVHTGWTFTIQMQAGMFVDAPPQRNY